MERIKYLERKLPDTEERLDEKYRSYFEKQAMYLGNGVYGWGGQFSTDTRELYLMGVLNREGIKYKDG